VVKGIRLGDYAFGAVDIVRQSFRYDAMHNPKKAIV
jgi:hypothetical protein